MSVLRDDLAVLVEILKRRGTVGTLQLLAGAGVECSNSAADGVDARTWAAFISGVCQAVEVCNARSRRPACMGCGSISCHCPGTVQAFGYEDQWTAEAILAREG